MQRRQQIIGESVQRVFRARYKIDEPGLVSHITQRASGREPLFLEDNDYLAMLALLKQSAKRFELTHFALCLMPNHIHILIRPEEKNLFAATRWIFGNYALWFNKKYHRKGHLFGGSYRQAICLDATYFLAASVYIHLNPVRAGLVEDGCAYRWSSCGLYCKETPAESFVAPDEVLSLLHAKRNRAVNQYKVILGEGQDVEQENVLEKDGVVERFCLQLAKIFPAVFKRIARGDQTGVKNERDVMELTELEKLTRDYASMKHSRQPESRKAKRFIVEQLAARGFKRQEIADRLGISRKTVYTLLHPAE